MIPRRFADSRKQSIATRLRRRRFRIFLTMLRENVSPQKILDIGGTIEYWDMMLADVQLPQPIHVTLLNVGAPAVSRPGFTSVAGDARSMPQYAACEFDIVFSNSAIEHVGSFAEQQRFASEVRRIGRRYYVQTPNRYFPIEPHFLFPFFQFLPVGLRAWLAQHFALGWYPKFSDRQAALREINSICLLSRNDFQRLFPEATILNERFFGLTKSFVAYTPKQQQKL